jgi:hypothetical protein
VQQQLQQMYVQLQRDLSTQISQATAGASSTPAVAPSSKVYLPKIRQPSAFGGSIGLAVDHWLSEMEQQFAYYSQSGTLCTDAQRIQYAAANLTGIAHQWWEQQADRSTLNDWSEFVERLHARFRPIQASMLARQRLDKLRMRDGTSVNAYIGLFHSITMPIKDMTESDRIHAFARGLTQRLAMKVWEQNPKSLKDAIDLAVMAEASGYYAGRGYSSSNHTQGGFRSSTNTSSNMGSAPMDLNHVALEDAMFEDPFSEMEPAASPSSSSSSQGLVDMEAMVQAAVEQRVNAMMSSFKSGGGGGRSFANGKKDHIPCEYTRVRTSPSSVLNSFSRRLVVVCVAPFSFVLAIVS